MLSGWTKTSIYALLFYCCFYKLCEAGIHTRTGGREAARQEGEGWDLNNRSHARPLAHSLSPSLLSWLTLSVPRSLHPSVFSQLSLLSNSIEEHQI